jgi:hypothetical protein
MMPWELLNGMSTGPWIYVAPVGATGPNDIIADLISAYPADPQIAGAVFYQNGMLQFSAGPIVVVPTGMTGSAQVVA